VKKRKNPEKWKKKLWGFTYYVKTSQITQIKFTLWWMGVHLHFY